MPTSITIRLHGDENQQHGSYLGSLMQGVLMEKIDPAYAEHLHMTGAHPYSQYIQASDNTLLWTVNALSEEAYEYIILPLLNDNEKCINLKHRQETLHIVSKNLEQVSFDELVQKYYLGNCSRKLCIRFLTPTGFKQDGKYCIFPTPRLIFQSLMLRQDAGAESSTIYSEEMVEEFEQYAEITDYRLRSVKYSLEGVRIPAFIGDCTFRIRGPQQLVNVAHMLAQYGRFSGVGIKTGLGMGAMTVVEDRRYNKKNSIHITDTQYSTGNNGTGKRGDS